MFTLDLYIWLTVNKIQNMVTGMPKWLMYSHVGNIVDKYTPLCMTD